MRKIKRLGEGETQLFVAIFEKSKLRNGVNHAQKRNIQMAQEREKRKNKNETAERKENTLNKFVEKYN